MIHDITPPRKINFDTPPKDADDAISASRLPTEVLIAELYQRGVTIERIFSQYYALEEINNHQGDTLLTVGDAALAGHPPQPPSGKAPF